MFFKLTFLFTILSSNLFSNAIATLVKVDGEVFYKRLEMLAFSKVPIGSGFKVYNNDLIKVGDNSFAAAIYLNNRAIVKIMKNSELLFEDKPKSENIRLKYGTLVNDIKKENRKKDFTIITPTHIASVKGTQFSISVKKNGFEKFLCKEGRIQVQTLNGSKIIILDEWQKAMKTPSSNLERFSANRYDYPKTPNIDYIKNEESNSKKSIRKGIISKIKDYYKPFFNKNTSPKDSSENKKLKDPSLNTGGRESADLNKKNKINDMQDKKFKNEIEKRETMEMERNEIKTNRKRESSD